jgi:hypothetical protein
VLTELTLLLVETSSNGLGRCPAVPPEDAGDMGAEAKIVNVTGQSYRMRARVPSARERAVCYPGMRALSPASATVDSAHGPLDGTLAIVVGAALFIWGPNDIGVRLGQWVLWLGGVVLLIAQPISFAARR